MRKTLNINLKKSLMGLPCDNIKMKKNLHMKRIYILIFTVLLFPSLKAQQLPISNQYLINPYAISSSYAGIDGTISGHLGFRKDWVSVKGAPESKYISLSAALGKKTGLGGYIISDRTDIFNNLFANISYTFHARFSENQSIGLSISGGLIEKNVDLSGANIKDNTDPLLLNLNNQHGLSTFAGAAILYRLYGLDIGVSAPILWESGTDFGEGSELNYALNRYYLGHLSYNFKVSEDWSVKPMGLLRMTENSPINYEGALMVNFRDHIWLCGLYRKSGIIGIGAGAAVSNSVVFNYTYEFSGSGIAGQSEGTHEITIGMRLGKATKKEEMIKKLQTNETSLKNTVDSLKRKTATLETELADLKRKQAEQEASGTPVEQEIKEKIATLEGQINKMKSRIDTTMEVLNISEVDYVAGRDYLLVVGAFAYEENAKKYAEKVRTQGYKPGLYYNAKRKMNYVFLNKFSDMKQAEKKKTELRAAGFKNAWIYYEMK
ncbi:PorP/SprF family type IX secretion system membrane protein [candidate division KSB1 bacterium]